MEFEFELVVGLDRELDVDDELWDVVLVPEDFCGEVLAGGLSRDETGELEPMVDIASSGGSKLPSGVTRRQSLPPAMPCAPLLRCVEIEGPAVPLASRPLPRRSDIAKRIAKADLPTKTCLSCGRPFTWRKKWERVWSEVRYCSERCRRAGKATEATAPPD